MNIKIKSVTDSSYKTSLVGAYTSIPDDVAEGYEFVMNDFSMVVQKVANQGSYVKLISPNIILTAEIL